MPRRGQLEPAAQADLAVERFAYDYQIGAFKRFAVFNFVRVLVQHRGQLPPARRARGGICGGCCGSAASDLGTIECAQ